MLTGIALGKFAPAFALDFGARQPAQSGQRRIHAALLWLTIIPVMMRVDFTAFQAVGKNPKECWSHAS